MLWKEKIDAPATLDILKTLERKEHLKGFEEIREESEENEQCSPAPSGSNTDRIFSDPAHEDAKRLSKSPKFNPTDLRFEVDAPVADENDPGRISHPKSAKARPKAKEPVRKPASPKGGFRKPIFRRSQSNEDARKLHKTIGSDDEPKTRPLGTTLRLLGPPKSIKASLRIRDLAADCLHSHSISLKGTVEAQPSSKNLDSESTERTRGRATHSSKPLSKGEKFWRQVLKMEAGRGSATGDLSRSSVFFGFEKVSKCRSSKNTLERSATDTGKPPADHSMSQSHVIDTVRDKRPLAFGRTNVVNMQPFLKPKARPTAAQPRWEDLDLLRKAGKKLSLEIGHSNSEGDR